MGFEPTRAEPNGLAVHRLNHSATSSYAVVIISGMINCGMLSTYIFSRFKRMQCIGINAL